MSTYNGWTNYATWRINLEIFDGFDIGDYLGDVEERDDPQYLADALRDYAEEIICMDTEEGLCQSYALAFLSDVNWYEIAQSLLEQWKIDNPQEVEDEE
jgi:hypothetical protein